MSKPEPPEREERPKVTSLLDRLPPGRRAKHLAMITFREHVKDPGALSRLGDWAAKLAGLDEDRVLAELARMRHQSPEVVITMVNYRAVRAAKRFMNGDAEGAFAEWAAIIEEHPDHCAEAFEVRSIFRIMRGELEEALADLTRTIELAPLSARPYVLRGRVCLELERVAEAMANFRRALQIDPADASALGGMGRCFVEAGQIDLAIRFYTRGIKRAPHRADLLAGRASCYEDLGRVDEAIADLDAAIALDPDDPELFQARGGCRSSYAEAVADFTRAIDLDPDDAGYRASRALARVEAGELEGAIADADRAIELDPSLPIAYLARGRVHHARGELERAAADHEEARRLAPDEIVYVMTLAAIHGELGDTAAFRADIDAAVAIDPTSAMVRALRGRIFLREGALDRAMEDFDAAFSLGESDIEGSEKAEVHHDAAEALAGLGRTEEAVRHEALAVEIAPDVERYAAALARLRAKPPAGD